MNGIIIACLSGNLQTMPKAHKKISHCCRLSQMCNRSETSDQSTHSSASLNEEQFEDYGEGEEGEYTPSNPCPDDEIRINGCSDLGSSVSSR